MRVTQMKKSANGVVVRGVRSRRLVLCATKSLEPIAVNILVSEILQVAVLPAEKNEAGEDRFTVAAQIGPEKWVRLAVFDSATDAEVLIESIAQVVSGSRWPDILLMTGLSIVAGFIFVTLGAYYVNSRAQANTQATPESVAQAGYTATLGQEELSASSISSPGVYAQPSSPAPAAGTASAIQMTPETEDAMKAYFGSK